MSASAPPTARASSTSPAPTAACDLGPRCAPTLAISSRSAAPTTPSASAPAAASTSITARRPYGLLRTYIRYEIDRNSGAFGGNGEIDDEPEAAAGLHPVRRPHRRSRDVVLLGPRPADDELSAPALRRPSNRTSTSSPTPTPSATASRPRCRSRTACRAASTTTLVFPAARGRRRPGRVFAPIPFTYGGNRMPDLVANVRYTGTWGGAQLSGAVHQIRDVAAGLTTSRRRPCPSSTRSPVCRIRLRRHGLRLRGRPQRLCQPAVPRCGRHRPGFRRPTRTARSATSMPARPSRSAAGRATASIGAGPLALPFADAFVDPFTGDFKTNKAYGIAGGVNHYWTPNWRTNVFGSWMRFDAPAIGAGPRADERSDHRRRHRPARSRASSTSTSIASARTRSGRRDRPSARRRGSLHAGRPARTRRGSAHQRRRQRDRALQADRLRGHLGRPSAHPARLLSYWSLAASSSLALFVILSRLA